MIDHQPPRPVSASARTALRKATDAAHTRLHQAPAFHALANGLIDLPAYRRLLARLYGFYRPIEHLLHAARWQTAAAIRMKHRCRAHLLYRDLLALGLPATRIAALPHAPQNRLPALTDVGRFLGCLYVHQGATIGGRVLARSLDPLLGPVTLSGRRFLTGTEHDVALWRLLCDALEAADQADRPGMIAGAGETFAALEAWLLPE